MNLQERAVVEVAGLSRRFVFPALVICLLAAVTAFAAAPEVLKVEPPYWWTGHSINPVRLLVRGRHFTGAEVAAGRGVRVSGVKTNAAGTYLFVDVTVPARAGAGSYPLSLTTPQGNVTIPFELRDPIAARGRFQGFSSDDIIYLIMPDRFANGDAANDNPAKARGLHDRSQDRYYHGGDLQGILERLPYLKNLGVTAIWMTPVYDNYDRLSKRASDDRTFTDYHGYGAVDFYAVDEHLGDIEKLRELVDAAHQHGIKVIQDQVANHTGPFHPWVNDPPTPSWYNGTAANHLVNTRQIWTLMDPHATPETRRTVLDGWFINLLPDLNQNNREVRQYIIQNTLWWLGTTGLDAIRQDTLPYVPRSFWREWISAIKREYPRVTVLGELFDSNPAMLSFYQGGRRGFDRIDTRVDTLFDYPTYFPLRRAFVEGQSVRQVAMALAHDHLYPRANQLVTFLGLHDVPRFMGDPAATAAGLRLAFTFLMTARGTPLIYYGDEIGLPGGGDPDNRRDFPGGWQGDPRNAFEATGRTPQEQEIVEHVQRLARLRTATVALRRGHMLNLLVEDQVWVYVRQGTPPAVVALNNGTQPASLDVAAGPAGLRDGTPLADALGGPDVRVEGGRLRLTLLPRSAAIFMPR